MLKILITSGAFMTLALGFVVIQSFQQQPTPYSDPVQASAPPAIIPATEPAAPIEITSTPVEQAPAPIQTTSDATRDTIRALSSGAFAGMKPTNTAPGTSEADDLQALIVQALRQGQTVSADLNTLVPPSNTTATTGERYVVKRGDSLGTIAEKFYGQKDGYKLIFEANRRNLKSPDSIRVGQTLIIPAVK